MRILTDELGGATGEATDLVALYRPPSLPWLRVNMVSTLDGAANGASGKSGSINNDADKQVFHALRAQADAIVVGAGTARTERYRVTDVEQVSAILRDRGVRLLYDAPRRGTADSRINFIHPKDAGGVLVELVEPAANAGH